MLYVYSGEKQMLAIRLPEDIEKRLDRLAKRTGRTKTYYAREAVLAHIEDLEDTWPKPLWRTFGPAAARPFLWKA